MAAAAVAADRSSLRGSTAYVPPPPPGATPGDALERAHSASASAAASPNASQSAWASNAAAVDVPPFRASADPPRRQRRWRESRKVARPDLRLPGTLDVEYCLQ